MGVLSDPPPPPPVPRIMQCTIAVAPSSPGDRITVSMDFLDAHATTVDHWQPHGTDLPALDDPCLVVVGLDGATWMIAWEHQP